MKLILVKICMYIEYVYMDYIVFLINVIPIFQLETVCSNPLFVFLENLL